MGKGIMAGQSCVKYGSAPGSELIEGMRLRPLAMHPDRRGMLAELFREEWQTEMKPRQWNAVRSEANVLRGVHVHVKHTDYLTLLQGRASIGLRDLRKRSATSGMAMLLEMSGDALSAITIPPGVAHGFYFHEPSLHIYAVSHYWDLADELGCRWDDPHLGIPWPAGPVTLSDRDAALPSLKALLNALEL